MLEQVADRTATLTSRGANDTRARKRQALIRPERADGIVERGDGDIAVAVDFAAAPPHTDRHYTRLDLLTDVLDLALPATHRHARSERVPLRDLAGDTWLSEKRLGLVWGNR